MTTMVGVLRDASILTLALVAMVTTLVTRDLAFAEMDEHFIELDSIRKRCAKRHPRDAKKQRQCFEEQYSAAVAIYNLIQENSKDKDWLEGSQKCTAHYAPNQVRDIAVVHRCLAAIPRKPQEKSQAPPVEKGFYDSFKNMCREDWPDSYEMQAFCVKQQDHAFEKLTKIFMRETTNDQVFNTIWKKCSREWRRGDTFNYEMLVFCIERELDAKKALDALR